MPFESVRKITIEFQKEPQVVPYDKESLNRAMGDLSKGFSIVTGSNCRCCVKYVDHVNNSFVAKTFCRNSGQSAQEGEHPIQHNTDFSELFHDPNRNWYFGNDLSTLASKSKYHNTSLDWASRYRSTLVWPIRYDNPQNDEAPDLLGYLCVDSRRIKPFSEEYDYPIGAMIADILSPFIMKVMGSLRQDAQQPTQADCGEVNVSKQITAPVESKPGKPPRTKSKD